MSRLSLERQIRLAVSIGLMLFALTIASFAQGPAGPPPAPAAQLQKMTESLHLTEPQQTTILPILESRHSAMEGLRKQGRTPESRQQMHTVMEMTTREIRAVLSEEQQRVFDAMQPVIATPAG